MIVVVVGCITSIVFVSTIVCVEVGGFEQPVKIIQSNKIMTINRGAVIVSHRFILFSTETFAGISLTREVVILFCILLLNMCQF